MSGVVRPYDAPGHVVMARHAATFMPEIEAMLVERQITAALAPAVAGLVDCYGWSIEHAIDQLALCLRS